MQGAEFQLLRGLRIIVLLYQLVDIITVEFFTNKLGCLGNGVHSLCLQWSELVFPHPGWESSRISIRHCSGEPNLDYA